MHKTGMSESTIHRTRRRLIARRLLAKQRRMTAEGRQTTNLYRVNLAKLREMVPPPEKYDDDLMAELGFEDDQEAVEPTPACAVTPTKRRRGRVSQGQGEGVTVTGGGCQGDTPGGARVTPKPLEETSLNHHLLPPPSSSTGTAAVATRAGGVEAEESPTIGEVLDDLPAPWLFGPGQRAQLAPLIEAAVAAGWQPRKLREHVTANPETVKTGFGAMRHRLRELPPAPRSKSKSAPTKTTKPSGPAWCGQCRQDDRRVESSVKAGRWVICPDCHPERPAP